MKIILATQSDIPYLKQLFIETVTSVNLKDYTLDQVNDWASCGIDIKKWEKRFFFFTHYKCMIENEITGFIAYNNEGFINSLFVSKNHQRKGVGQTLLNHLLIIAHQNQWKTLKVEVSITARPFFIKNGFIVIKQQLAKADKLHLKNFVMVKFLND